MANYFNATMHTLICLIFLLILLQTGVTDARFQGFPRPRPVKISPPEHAVVNRGGIKYHGKDGFMLSEKEILRQRAEEEFFETIIERVLDVLADYYGQEDVPGDDATTRLRELKKIGIQRELVIEALYSLTTTPRVRVYTTFPVDVPSIIPSSGIHISYFLPPVGNGGLSIAIRTSAAENEGDRASCTIQLNSQDPSFIGNRDQVTRILIKTNTCQDLRYTSGCLNSCTQQACSGLPYICQDEVRQYFDVASGSQCEMLPVNDLCSPSDFEALEEIISSALESQDLDISVREYDYEDAPEVLLKDEVDLSGVENKINNAMADEAPNAPGDITIFIVVAVLIAFVLLALGSKSKKNNSSSRSGPSPMSSNTNTTTLNMT